MLSHDRETKEKEIANQLTSISCAVAIGKKVATTKQHGAHFFPVEFKGVKKIALGKTQAI